MAAESVVATLLIGKAAGVFAQSGRISTIEGTIPVAAVAEAEADDGSAAEPDTDDGLELPLWQLEVAIGDLFAFFAAATVLDVNIGTESTATIHRWNISEAGCVYIHEQAPRRPVPTGLY